ncbi:glycosyltransferase family 39 protein [Luteimonas sp. RD2P54]|uniref:Glycosyltransferase family 39 protein n=1 Tax=Luteimonas endophytica TaxID=3042023 RepID=A0ABT6J3K1_9GAMM|nr:glycosyltransferase family 39 protein [Luteimonas endophytica]MDH5821401.1 glycosyltransferase family 39 protein [Luteimonas endophytica]
MRGDDARALQARRAFLWLWGAVCLVKLVLAAQLPLFVDEAFYWQEGQHPAWAYSDLPGLTAWLIRIGVEVAGNTHLGVRLPFLLIAAALPWLMVRIVAREFDERSAWLAGSATVLLPLAGSLGLLALPDVPMALATLLCIDAGARLLRRVDYNGPLVLALGLAIGALSHYRFIAVIGVGIVALLLLPAGRRALRDPRVWVAVAFGAAAWVPLLAWNLDNAEAGLRFQLIDRHPWALHPEGILFLPLQVLLVSPLLFVALLWAAWRTLREGTEVQRLFALLGGLVVAGFFGLGFFADTERVSFHWPLPGYLALLALLPALLDAWPRWLRRATWGLAAAGLVSILGYYVAVSIPAVRAQSAALKWYPSNFAGWDTLAETVAEVRAGMPPETRIVAGNFKIGAELGFALEDPRIAVLDHPLNRAHGRAPQLQLWGLHTAGRSDWGDDPVLLVVGATDVPYRDLLRRYQALCERVGPLPPPRVLNIDHGRQRFLLFALSGAAQRDGPACVTPALAWIDVPVAGSTVQAPFEVSGWAFKDGIGLYRVEVTLDGEVVAEAEYGLPAPGVAGFWGGSTDPSHPDVGFRATLGADAPLPPGRHWLGLRLHGRDRSVEDWSEQPLEIE